MHDPGKILGWYDPYKLHAWSKYTSAQAFSRGFIEYHLQNFESFTKMGTPEITKQLFFTLLPKKIHFRNDTCTFANLYFSI